MIFQLLVVMVCMYGWIFVFSELRLGGFSAGDVAADSRAMDRRNIMGNRLARKHQSGCTCAVRLTEPVANGRRMGSRRDSGENPVVFF